MKTTSAKIQLQQLALILNKKGHWENCAQTQTVFDETKLKAQLFQKRPNHLRAKPPLASHIGLAIASSIYISPPKITIQTP
jgi:hypothetical protein